MFKLAWKRFCLLVGAAACLSILHILLVVLADNQLRRIFFPHFTASRIMSLHRRLHPSEVAEVVHSLNPPPAFPLSYTVVGIACGIRDDPDLRFEEQPLLNVLIPSSTPFLERGYYYRYYFTYDSGDPTWQDPLHRQVVVDLVASSIPAGVNVTVHFIECDNCREKPSWAHSKAVVAAYLEGCDYVLRINDDTQFVNATGWTGALIRNLQNREIPNLGVVGPDFEFAGEIPILPHDFTHWIHVAIHGYHYPPQLPNWSSDDWITYVYDQFKLAVKMKSVLLRHVTKSLRYVPSDTPVRQRALTITLARGANRIKTWAAAYYDKDLVKDNRYYRTP